MLFKQMKPNQNLQKLSECKHDEIYPDSDFMSTKLQSIRQTRPAIQQYIKRKCYSEGMVLEQIKISGLGNNCTEETNWNN